MMIRNWTRWFAVVAFGLATLVGAQAPPTFATSPSHTPAKVTPLPPTIAYRDIPKDILAKILLAEDSRNGTTLRALLAEKPPAPVRDRILLALGRIGAPADMPPLLEALGSDDENARLWAAFSLGEAQDPNVLTQFARKADEKVPVALLVRLDALLAGGLDEAEWNEAVRVSEALGKIVYAPSGKSMGQVAVAWSEAVAKNADNKPTDVQRERARILLIALARLKDMQWTANVEFLFAADDLPVRGWVLNAITRAGGLGKRQFAIKAIDDHSPLAYPAAHPQWFDAAEVRAQAVTLLSKNLAAGDSGSFEMLLKVDHAMSSRLETYRALGKTQDQQTEGILRAEMAPLIVAADMFGHQYAATFGEDATRLVTIIDALGGISSDLKLVDLLEQVMWHRNVVGYRAIVANAKICKRAGKPERFFQWPKRFKVTNFEANKALAEALAEVAPAADGEALIGKMLVREGAPIETNAILAAVAPTLLDSAIKYDLPQQTSMMLDFLDDDDRMTRVAAAINLAAENRDLDPETVPKLVDMLDRDADRYPDARQAMMETLGKWLDDKNAIVGKWPDAARRSRQAIERRLGDKEYLVRALALKLLADKSPEEVEKTLGDRGTIRQEMSPRSTDEVFYGHVAGRAGTEIVALFKFEDGKFMAVELFEDEAPLTVENFVHQVQRGYFAGLSFHRVFPHFVLQGGDPRQDMSGGPGYEIPCEINTIPFTRGTMGMALSGKDTGGTQFFFTHNDTPHLDGGYTVFGRILPELTGWEAELEALKVPPGDIINGFDRIDGITQYTKYPFVTVMRKGSMIGEISAASMITESMAK